MVSRLIRKRRPHPLPEQEGFTLIELLVVLLIIGILLAIAIPTFLSVTSSATDTAAQTNLKSSLVAAKSYLVSPTGGNGSYTGLVGAWGSLDAGMVGGAAYSSGPTVVSVSSTSTQAVLAIYANTTKRCWGIVDDFGSGGTELGQPVPGIVYFGAEMADPKNCVASTFQNDANLAAKQNASVSGFPDPTTF